MKTISDMKGSNYKMEDMLELIPRDPNLVSVKINQINQINQANKGTVKMTSTNKINKMTDEDARNIQSLNAQSGIYMSLSEVKNSLVDNSDNSESSVNNKINKETVKMSEIKANSDWSDVIADVKEMEGNKPAMNREWDDITSDNTPTTTTSTSAIEWPDMPKKESGAYYKRTSNSVFLRFYKFDHEGQAKLMVPKYLHWEGNKATRCSGKGCELCKTARPQVKMTINVVDRKQTPNKIQIWDMPVSIAAYLQKYHEGAGDAMFGNSGKTFRIDYDEATKKYIVMPFDKDSAVLTIDKSYDLLNAR
jgi:hypothetical protein